MTLLFDGMIFTLFAIDHRVLFDWITNNSRLTIKQKAYILSIKSSLVLFILSIYWNYLFAKCGFDFKKFNDTTCNDQKIMQQMTVIFLASYLVMDTYLGNKFYHQYMTSLSGYPHHIIYTIVCLVSLYTEWYSLFLLYFVAELPTFFLALGSFNKRYRNDNLFGFTFLLTRILYHIFLTYKLVNHVDFGVGTRSLLTVLASLILLVHCYWFKQWINKYLFKEPKSVKEA
jgi:hypothetical protein